VDKPIIVDTDVLVDFRRGASDASNFCAPLVVGRVAAVHPVTLLELFDGVTNRLDVAATRRMVSALRRIPVRDADFIAAQSHFENLQPSHGVGWADCLIASTALRLRVPVATLNRKHFRAFQGLSVISPY
jgi:predicted nucleic acid-binding protein